MKEKQYKRYRRTVNVYMSTASVTVQPGGEGLPAKKLDHCRAKDLGELLEKITTLAGKTPQLFPIFGRKRDRSPDRRDLSPERKKHRGDVKSRLQLPVRSRLDFSGRSPIRNRSPSKSPVINNRSYGSRSSDSSKSSEESRSRPSTSKQSPPVKTRSRSRPSRFERESRSKSPPTPEAVPIKKEVKTEPVETSQSEGKPKRRDEMKKSMEKLKKNLQKAPKPKPVTPKTEPSDFELEIEVNTAELEIEDINRALGDEQVVHVDAFYPQKFTCTPFLSYFSHTFYFRSQGNLPRNRATQGQITVRASLFLGIFLAPFPNISQVPYSLLQVPQFVPVLYDYSGISFLYIGCFPQSDQQSSVTLTSVFNIFSGNTISFYIRIFLLSSSFICDNHLSINIYCVPV